MQQLPNEVDEPGLFVRCGHGGEPHLPIQPVVIGRNPWRNSKRVPRLAFKLICLPVGLRRNPGFLGPFKNNLWSFTANCPKGAIRIHKMPLIKGSVHNLSARKHVARRLNAKVRNNPKQYPGGDLSVLDAACSSSPQQCVIDNPSWHNAPQCGIIEAADDWTQGQPVQKRKIST